MNELNNVLQEILTEKPQSKILAWKSKTIPNAFILKQEGKRYLGLLRKDKNGQDYWKYLPLKDKETSALKTEQVSTPSSVEKYQQRLEKEGVHSELSQKTQQINHGNNSNTSKG